MRRFDNDITLPNINVVLCLFRIFIILFGSFYSRLCFALISRMNSLWSVWISFAVRTITNRRINTYSTDISAALWDGMQCGCIAHSYQKLSCYCCFHFRRSGVSQQLIGLHVVGRGRSGEEFTVPITAELTLGLTSVVTISSSKTYAIFWLYCSTIIRIVTYVSLGKVMETQASLISFLLASLIDVRCLYFVWINRFVFLHLLPNFSNINDNECDIMQR